MYVVLVILAVVLAVAALVIYMRSRRSPDVREGRNAQDDVIARQAPPGARRQDP